MVSATLLKVGGIYSLILFLVTIFISFMICSFVGYASFSTAFAITLICIIIANLLKFFKSEENKTAWINIWAIIFSVVSLFIVLFLPQTYHTSESYLNRFVIYLILGISLCGPSAMIMRVLIGLILPGTAVNSGLDEKQEKTLYYVSNLLVTFFNAALIANTSDGTNQRLGKHGLVNSIIAWFIGAAFGFAIGYIVDSKAAPLTGAYESKIEPNSGYDAVA